QSSPHHLGVEGCVNVLEDLLAAALQEAGLGNGGGQLPDVAQLLLAGVDFPSEEEEVLAAVTARRLAKRVNLRNDTFAVLGARAGGGGGVAAGGGRGPRGRGGGRGGGGARSRARGDIRGGGGGGYGGGRGGVGGAGGGGGGRAPKTPREPVPPRHFGLETPT